MVKEALFLATQNSKRLKRAHFRLFETKEGQNELFCGQLLPKLVLFGHLRPKTIEACHLSATLCTISSNRAILWSPETQICPKRVLFQIFEVQSMVFWSHITQRKLKRLKKANLDFFRPKTAKRSQSTNAYYQNQSKRVLLQPYI